MTYNEMINDLINRIEEIVMDDNYTIEQKEKAMEQFDEVLKVKEDFVDILNNEVN